MAENSISENVGKAMLGGAVGFALYLLISGLGFGGKGRGGAFSEGRGPGEATTERPAPLPSPPPRPRDEKRLTFVMVQPLASEPYNPTLFQLVEEGRKTYSLGGLISRVKAGGRGDVGLKIRGDIRQGSADDAMVVIRQAGIEVWEEKTTPAPAVSGVARDRYGGRGYYRGRGRH